MSDSSSQLSNFESSTPIPQLSGSSNAQVIPVPQSSNIPRPKKSYWEDRGTHYYLPHNRLKTIPKGFLTGGKILKALTDPKPIIDHMRGKSKIKAFDPVMAEQGNHYEKMLFEWYRVNVDSSIAPAGAAVAKDTDYILTISDGELKDGLVEFKTTRRISEATDEDKVKISDYIQILAQLNSYKKKWVDYVVYAIDDQTIVRKRVYFDGEFWKKIEFHCGNFMWNNGLKAPVIVCENKN